MNETTLVHTAQRGDREAFGELVQRYQHALVASARQLTGCANDAEDLAQETCIEAYRHLPSLQDPAKFRAWLFGILRNRCAKFVQRRRPAPLPLEEETLSVAAPLPADTEELTELLAALPASDREILVARYLHGLEYHEIAVALGITAHTARMRVSRVRTRLRHLADMRDDAQAREAFAVLLLFPLNAFTDRVLTEVDTMAQLTTPAAMTATTFSLPALLSGAAGKVALGLVLALGAGGVYLYAGSRGHAPLPTPSAETVATAGSSTAVTDVPHAEARAARMQRVLDKTVAWIAANQCLPEDPGWIQQVGITEDEYICPEAPDIGVMMPGFNAITVEELLAQAKEPAERVPLLIEVNLDNTMAPAFRPDGTLLVGFLDGHVDTVHRKEVALAAEKMTPTEACVDNLKMLAMALRMYEGETKQFPGADWRAAIADYTPNPRKWVTCPLGENITYAYNMAVAGKRFADFAKPAGVVLLYEVENNRPVFRHEGKMSVAFIDGSVRWLTPKEFARYGVK